MRHPEGGEEEEFSDQELLAALSRIMSVDKAAAQVRDMRAFDRALDASAGDAVQHSEWEPSTFIMKTWSPELLALLSLVSPEATAKVRRWRARRGLSDDDPEWQARVSAMRRLTSGGE